MIERFWRITSGFLAMVSLWVTTVVSMPAIAENDRAMLTADAALSCVAARFRGEVLAINADASRGLQEVRWLTPTANVLKILLSGPGCRFLEVDGVGQMDARILPQETE